MFSQLPNVHLKAKKPCPKCSKNILTNDFFIKKSQKKHQGKFDYIKSIYNGYDNEIIIICKKHGSFKTTPANHLNTQNGGCNHCASNKNKTTEGFIKKSKAIHGKKYNYSLVEYKNNYTKVKIICSKHGVFEQSPANHYKYGCVKCSGKYLFSNEEFIELSKIIHGNKYDYSEVNYQGMFVKVKINCNNHGTFHITPTNHIHGKKGCSKCSSRISKGEIEWLDKLKIPKSCRNVYMNLGGKKFFVDGLIKSKKIVYEYNGDYWHGNPDLYDSKDIHPEAGVTFGYLWKKTQEKKQTLEEAGFTVISIWESEFNGKNNNK